MGVAFLERPRPVRTLLRPAGQAAQEEENRLGLADAPVGEALVARTRDCGRGRCRFTLASGSLQAAGVSYPGR